MRTLATVQQIENINPIPDADSIEVAKVLGWHVVVKKGQFNIGDKCIYCEIDSVLPPREEFEFLKDKKYRIKTVKLRGQVSQGICFPTNILTNEELPIGYDVTEMMGVVKYDPPEPAIEKARLGGKIRGSFPNHIPKTDETRIQSVPGVLTRHKGKQFVVLEKIDGTSMTVFNDVDTGLHVCSRGVDLAPDFRHKYNGTAYWQYVVENEVWKLLEKLGNVALQGELFGPGISGSGNTTNKYNMKELNWRVFSIYDIDNHRYFDHKVLEDAVEAFGVKTLLVPKLGEIELDHTVDQLVELSRGKSKISDVPREGLVLRSIPESIDKDLGRLSFKVINPDFLLRFGG